jgi:hypothetical protein
MAGLCGNVVFEMLRKKDVDEVKTSPYKPLHSSGDGPLGSLFASRLFQSDLPAPGTTRTGG